MNTRAQTFYRPGSVLVWVLLVGLIAGVIGTAQWFDSARGDILPIVPCLVVAAMGLCIPRWSRQVEWSTFYGAVLGVAAFAFPLVGMALITGGGSAVLRSRFLIPLASASLLCAIGGGTALALWTWLYRTLCPRAVIDDAPRCAKCGYCISHLETARCPECGQEFGDLRHYPASYPASVRSARRARIWARMLLVGLVCLAGGILVWRTNRPWIVLIRPDYWSYVSSPSSDVEAFYRLVGDLLLVSDHGFRISPSGFRAIVGDPDWFAVDDTGIYYIYKEGLDGSRVSYVDFPGGELHDFQPNSDPSNIHWRYKPCPKVVEFKNPG